MPRPLITALAMLVAASAACAQITVPAGFAVDQLVGRLDNATPRLTAITNPAFGNGVISASVSNGILQVRAISDGEVRLVASAAGLSPTAMVTTVRFVGVGALAPGLYITVVSPTGTGSPPRATTLYRIDASGAIQQLAQSGLDIDLKFDAPPESAGYAPGLWGHDGADPGGEDVMRISPDFEFVEVLHNPRPPGRPDFDVAAIAFDTSGAFGGCLIFADSDDLCSSPPCTSRLTALNPDLTWSALSPTFLFSEVRYTDLAVSPGGTLGGNIYITNGTHDTVMRVPPSGAHEPWAADFVNVWSLSVGDGGDTLYVSDTNGVYRIRPLGSVPGPTLIAREPSLPPGIPFTNVGGIASTRLIWSAPVLFSPSDIAITDAGGAPVPFAASGSGSAFTLLSFGAPLADDAYMITVQDSAHALNGTPIDGDNDGIAGGDAVLNLVHATCTPAPACPADFNGDGQANIQDFLAYLAAFAQGCP